MIMLKSIINLFFRHAPLSPDDVFTPNAEAKTDMYIERPDLEKALAAITSRDHVYYMYGFSGSGKTWLYQQVFQAKSVPFEVIDSAVMLPDNFHSMFEEHLAIKGRRKATKETATVGSDRIATAGVESELRSFDPALEVMRGVGSSLGRKRKGVLIIENVESLSRNDYAVRSWET